MDLYIYYLYNHRIQFDCNLDNLRSELKARNEIIDNDSECDTDDYLHDTTHCKDWHAEHHQQATSPIAPNTNDDILIQQHKLKEAATMALVSAAKTAHVQVEREREALAKKRSSLYDLMGIDVNMNKPFMTEVLEEMNIGQLQVITNELYCLIEANNDKLVNLLIERDSLSMEQDSILVDVEDIQKRAQERVMSISSQVSLSEPTQYVYIVKRPQPNTPKTSVFQNLLRKAMIIS